MKTMQIEVDYNLLYLSNILFDLDSRHFDEEVSKLLNELRFLLDEKMYSKLNLKNRDVINQKLIMKYFFN